MTKRFIKRVREFLPAAAGVLFLGAVPVVETAEAALDSYEPWDEEVVDLFRRLPVQDDGRIKPFESFAQFRMYRLHGKRSMRFKAGAGDTVESFKIGPTEWMLDLLFRPELAEQLPTFQVNDSRIVTALGLTAHEKRRDHYTYAEIVPGRRKLSELGMEYSKIEEADRTYEKSLLLNLASNVNAFEFLTNQFGFARKGIPVDLASLPAEVYGDAGEALSVAEMLERMDALRDYLAGDQSKISDGLEQGMRILQFYADSARGLAFFPPPEKEDGEWLGVGAIITECIENDESLDWGLARLGLIEEVAGSAGDQGDFLEAAQKLSEQVSGDAAAREEGAKVGMEVSFYKAKYFYRALILFFLGFLLTAFSWLAPTSKLSKGLNWGVVGCSVAGLLILTTGIVIRSIIQSRAPIYNLYDTILCITATAVLVSLLMEYVNRQRLGLGVSVALGAAGMFLAMRFEVKNAADTMESMRAVLASNFWLSTHVTSVIIGYAGGLLAAGIAHVYILARLFGVKKGDRDFYRSATRMTYGVLCFSLFFALVGTVLGGIWANYSWGRFWGWDPKENGALMIVIWTLAILHARMGGYIRDLGINMCAIFGAIIVSFSWWGVNNLGVGLHSYGFTEGVWPALFTFWGVEMLVIGIGVTQWVSDREDKKSGPRPDAGAKAAA